MSNNAAIDLRLKSFFDLSEEERQERLRPTYEAMKKEKFAKGGYITYYDPSVCPTTSHAVHEYVDRKDLMWMDDKYQEHFIKTL
ncbi:hypothetical protein D0C36_14805 [Mucilaginibacter conchicola]|uniref:Uncharacterized protein n=2 Tax=Mucilaginibacter TaxID=423349 RepID=A0A372NTV8_9SPHI|nr:hypothetical protein [Mucilaginibacter sp. Bleaf8]MBS7565660.1 hypothetical protein [Mucilaginibacter sp. Bleaf8]RFZ92676.1 hypothetical protein D0C36_14805 [Mucilaginibacter conchicola]